MRKILLYIGAGITILFIVMHAMFWKLGGWHDQLPKWTQDNAGIMQMLNITSIYTLIFGTWITLVLAKKQTLVFIEKACLLFMAGYYFMRIAFGPSFFGFSIIKVIVWIICLVAAGCYLFALPQNKAVSGSSSKTAGARG